MRAAILVSRDSQLDQLSCHPTALDLDAIPASGRGSTAGAHLPTDRDLEPAGLTALRQAVAASAADSEVWVTHGVSGGFRAALEAFVDPGRPVVLLAPCSPLFIAAARCHRARVRWVPTRVEAGRLRLDFDTLSRAMRGAALFAVADPGNPVGVPLADDDADRLRWTAERSDVLLFVDETYRRYRVGSGTRRLAELAPDRTLVAGSLTAAGHAALRVGWLSGPPSLVQACGLMQSATAGEVPAVCQHLAWRALTTGTTDREAEAVRVACRDAASRLRGMGFGVADPADGCFLWANVSHTGHTGRSFAEGLLAAEGVRVGPGDRHGPGGESFVRLCAAADPGRLREGLNRIARFVGSPSRPRPAAKPTPARRPAFSRG